MTPLEAYLSTLPEWQDDLKARSMFASFSQPRDVNPEAWDARFNFWRDILLNGLDRGLLGPSVFRLDKPENLAFKFQRNHINPLGLNDVVHEMRNRSLLTAMDSFKPSSPIIERLFWSPLRSSWSLFFSNNSTEQLHIEIFAAPLLQKWSEALLDKISELSQRNSFAAYFTLSTLQKLLSELRVDAGLSPLKDLEDVRTLVKYMKSKNMLVELEDPKLAEPILRIRLASERGPLSISKEQRNIVQLRTTASNLNEHISELEGRIQVIKSQALTSLKDKDRNGALLHLRRSKEYEKLKNQRISCLTTIESILIQIENSYSDAKVLEAYQLGQSTLRTMLASMQSVNTMDDVMVGIQELISDHQLISQSMAQPLEPELEADLEDELAQLIDLPSVPTSATVFPAEKDLGQVQDQLEHLRINTASPDTIDKIAGSQMIRFKNSLSGSVEALKTQTPGILNWYACGPTVYDHAHLGHARNYITHDIIRRILERHGRLKVNLQMGITDVDDKILKKASTESGGNIIEISKKFEKSFLEDLTRLNVALPSKFSSVSDSIPDIVQFVQKLLDSGIAYQASSGSIYFSIEEYTKRGFKYPKFIRCTHSNIDHSSEKRNCSDFALWKAAKADETVFWEAFNTKGRPGWHIECSAMIHHGLGHIDLHTGGVDLRFPHHENEIAQSEAFYGSEWRPQFLHVGHVKFEGEKMSKSLGNVVSIGEFIRKHSDASNMLRMICLIKHYSSDFDLDQHVLQQASNNLEKLKTALINCRTWKAQNLSNAANSLSSQEIIVNQDIDNIFASIESSFKCDFDTPLALRSVSNALDLGQPYSHPLILDKLENFMLTFCNDLGLSLREDSFGPFLAQELDRFRANVREIALTTRSSELLSLCDQIRQNLSSKGFNLRDKKV